MTATFATNQHPTWREERRADQAAAAERQRLTLAAQREERRRDLAAAEARAATRTAARRQRRRELWAALPDHGMSMLWATMIVAPITLAWQAQAAFAADTLNIAQPWHHVFPLAIEVGAWVCAFEAHRRARRCAPVGSLLRWMWLLAGIAAVINAAHGIRDAGVPGGLALGALSLLGVLLHSIRQGLDAENTGARAPLAAWRRVRFPRLSLAAASIRAATGTDAETAWVLAWTDRFGVGPEASRRDRVLGKLITKKELRDDKAAARRGELSIIGGRVSASFAPEVRAYVDEERQAALARVYLAEQAAESVIADAQDALTAAGLLFGPDALTEGSFASETGSEQGGQLSARAAELLPALRVAIESGEVRQCPKTQHIRAWVRETRKEGLGVPVAQELRDAVATLRLVDVGQDADAVAGGA